MAGPDIFFLYGGSDFGAFGLARGTRLFLLGVVGVGAAALASGRVRWVHAQVAVLAAFAVVAIPNVQRFDVVLARGAAADRGLGKTARALCGGGPQDVIALGTPTSFVPLYFALYALKRPAPLILSKTPQAVFAVQPAGRCVLTTLPPPPNRYVRLAGSPALTLARVR